LRGVEKVYDKLSTLVMLVPAVPRVACPPAILTDELPLKPNPLLKALFVSVTSRLPRSPLSAVAVSSEVITVPRLADPKKDGVVDVVKLSTVRIGAALAVLPRARAKSASNMRAIVLPPGRS
jgi:hypothetical protein